MIKTDDKAILSHYFDDKMSIPDISKILGISKSTIRRRILKYSQPRNTTDAINLVKHKLGRPGIKRTFTKEWCENMRIAALRRHSISAKGFTIKKSGYIQITNGENIGRGVHDVLMEQFIGRKLLGGEIVHHINKDRSDNRIENLKLMTISEHSRLHAEENYLNRKRNKKGQFV